MDIQALQEMIRQLREGNLGEGEFLASVRNASFLDLGEVKIDTHRALRQGFSEIVYCPGKSPEQLCAIANALAGTGEQVLFSRASEEDFATIREILPTAVHYPKARIVASLPLGPLAIPGVTVISAGSSDVPVAEEAAVVAEHMGCRVTRLFDVGVAGIHRLLAHTGQLQSARAIVAVAGMEGALPTVVGGLVSCPVIAVPTSVGYGANLNGFAPLLTMLNSCALGVSVVNIDNGLGAGFSAAQIARQCHQAEKEGKAHENHP